MTLRRTTSVLFASVLLAGGVAVAAQAAPAKPHTTTHKAAATMHRAAPKPMHTAARRTAPASTRAAAVRGGDAQNATVDQLNAQSLQRAQTGAPAQ